MSIVGLPGRALTLIHQCRLRDGVQWWCLWFCGFFWCDERRVCNTWFKKSVWRRHTFLMTWLRWICLKPNLNVLNFKKSHKKQTLPSVVKLSCASLLLECCFLTKSGAKTTRTTRWRSAICMQMFIFKVDKPPADEPASLSVTCSEPA